MPVLFAAEDLPVFSPRRMAMSLRIPRGIWALCYSAAALFWVRPDPPSAAGLLTIFLVGDIGALSAIAFCRCLTRQIPYLEMGQLLVLLASLSCVIHFQGAAEYLVAILPASWSFFAVLYLGSFIGDFVQPFRAGLLLGAGIFCLGTSFIHNGYPASGVADVWLGAGAAVLAAALLCPQRAARLSGG